MPVIGLGKHAARLASLSGPGVRRAVSQVLQNGAERVVVEARRLIVTGSVTGAGHVPSRPGEPPNNNWGTLAGNIEDRLVAWDVAEVSSNAPYAAFLEMEFGTSKMAARPYMAPARDNTVDSIEADMVRAIDALVKRS